MDYFFVLLDNSSIFFPPCFKETIFLITRSITGAITNGHHELSENDIIPPSINNTPRFKDNLFLVKKNLTIPNIPNNK